MKLVYKKIKRDNGTITFYHTGKYKKLYYATPERNKDKGWDIEPFFIHNNRRYYLSEFMSIAGMYAPDFMQEFDGYLNDTFFSGYAIKLDPEGEDRVKLFLFIS